MTGPGWEATPLDDRDEVTASEVESLYRGSQNAVYDFLFQRWTAGLPPGGYTHGSAAHNIPIFAEAMDRTKAKAILEIGFGVGYSAAILMNLHHQRRVTSVDNTHDLRAHDAAAWLKLKGRKRFTFVNQDSRTVALDAGVFDFIYLDGATDHETVLSDLALASRLRVPWVLANNIWPAYGAGVLSALAAFPLEQVRSWGNVRLYRNPGA